MSERFEALYHRHVHAVFRFALSCVGRRQVAEDITSEAFLALLRNLDGVDATLLPAWLITVARNRARDHWRREAREQKFLEGWNAPEAVAHETAGGWLLDCPELKPVHRVCLTLRYVEGMSRAEIAAATSLSETQVKGHLQYGLQLLRKAVTARPRC